MMSTQPTVEPAAAAADRAEAHGRRDSVRPKRRRWLATAALATGLLALTGTSSALARDDARNGDHEDARRALLAGEVRPLRQVLDDVAREFPGEPVKIEFERDDGIYIYEIKLLQPSGSVVKLKIDARTGAVLKVKGRNIERRPR